MAAERACAYCDRAAPAPDDPALLAWEGGEALYEVAPGEAPDVALVCPDCRGPAEAERDEGAGD